MAATRTAARTALSSQNALGGITRQLMALELGAPSRNFATSGTSLQGEEEPSASTSTSTPDFGAIINGPESSPAASTSTTRTNIILPVSTSSASSQKSSKGFRHLGLARQLPPAPYRLHAHCTKHNTILALTKDLPESLQSYTRKRNVEGAFNALESGKGVSEEGAVDPSTLGQTVLRTSPGLLGLKKAQRGTFEAASRASVQMFNLIAQLGTKDRTNKKGQKVRDLRPTSIELIFKGFGPGREALVAALNSTQGDQVRQKISRITDATPIKIGGTRPKKRKKLSPPLDLGRRRR